MEGLSHDQGLKALAMAAFHDLVEARTGDLDFVAKHYSTADEEKAVNDQFSGFSFSDDLKNLIIEYEDRQTMESKCAKDADGLEQMYQKWVLAWQDNDLAKRWFDSDFVDRVPRFRTESAKNLAFSMKESNPHEWWWSQFIENNSAKDIEKLLGKQ